MAETVYALCAITSLSCAALLFFGYRAERAPLLFWASLGFMGLALNNILLFVDLIILPTYDLFLWRTVAALAGMVLLLYGLIRETK